MLTEDMSTTGWWILALASGAALGYASLTLADKRKPSHRVISVAVPGSMGLFLWAQARFGSLEGRQALFFFTLISLSLAILRAVYHPWFRRQFRLRDAGEPMENATTPQVFLFLFSFVATFAGVAFLVH
ncbi:hypothetical protein [Streptomyces acidiscabies]|uniref:Uncharacterized protein n=1 Tax=Streptomyces acidiscabies TaxID=42234 RepID=A0A0L0JKM6_9ACTN|nr:hypothetical protein [Streptomyces acidiscabies]KND26004.1 hypothetical protein IQ63_37805 [Streptomyces acidiscabies]GAQ58796.1 hypothetical protein a10_08692 [Streptomyces acidiscabies]